MRKIRVLVVDDSLLFQQLLVRYLNQNPSIEVVATAADPFEARDAIIEYRPDVMTLDIELPRMDGIEFLRKLMPQYPIPTIVISAANMRVFDAMQAGAVDFVAKPSGAGKAQIEEFVLGELPAKIRIAAMARLRQSKRQISLDTNRARIQADASRLVIAVGASTGGTEAAAQILRSFGKDIPGVVLVQHMPEGFTGMYARRLDNECRVYVKEAVTGDVIRPGQVLIAPGGDAHMEVVKVGTAYQVLCRKGAKVNGHCPSVEVLFRSVARNVGKNALGIILTGMGADGAKGLLEMRQAGAHTIGQDESSCVVYGMPKVAYEIGAVEHQVKLADIADKTYALINTYK